MAHRTTSGRWRALAAALTLALVLAGLGRAAASTAEPPDAIPGVHAPICHAGGGDRPVDRSAPHGCCDACALLVPAVMPSAPSWPAPAAAVTPVGHGRAPVPGPSPSRPRDPRQSRGPPAA